MLDLTRLQELKARIVERTGGQVRELMVANADEEPVVSGQSSSWYLKQLATQAVREILPEIAFRNQIRVVC